MRDYICLVVLLELFNFLSFLLKLVVIEIDFLLMLLCKITKLLLEHHNMLYTLNLWLFPTVLKFWLAKISESLTFLAIHFEFNC